MTGRARALLLPAVFAFALAGLSGLAGYVYAHEPARDTLLVEYEGTPPPSPTYLTGAITALDEGSGGSEVTLDVGQGGRRTVTLPDGAPVDALLRSSEPLEDGAPVNVGVDETSFAQVLTGVVVIEEAR